jgi:hypothetical protein
MSLATFTPPMTVMVKSSWDEMVVLSQWCLWVKYHCLLSRIPLRCS